MDGYRLLHVVMIIPDREACASASACCGVACGLDLVGGAMEGGGAGGLGYGPLFPLLTGSDAPMLNLVPAHTHKHTHLTNKHATGVSFMFV